MTDIRRSFAAGIEAHIATLKGEDQLKARALFFAAKRRLCPEPVAEPKSGNVVTLATYRAALGRKPAA